MRPRGLIAGLAVSAEEKAGERAGALDHDSLRIDTSTDCTRPEGLTMAFKVPSGSFVHAASYAQLTLSVCEHLFPSAKIFELSADQRRILENETKALLVQARWTVDSVAFASNFAMSMPSGAEAPSATVLGDPVPPATPADPLPGGGYR